MGNLKRRFWGGYYKTEGDDNKNYLLGSEILHSYYCGSFTLEGKEYNLMFFLLCKDDLPDTKGKNQESFDSFPFEADSIIPLSFLVEGDISPYAPSVQYLISQDLEEGLDPWDIINRRMGVMVDSFVEFNFHQVLSRYPDILKEEEMEDGSIVQNIWKCSLEDEG